VPIADTLVPDLKGFRTNRVEDRKETWLEGVFEHIIILVSIF
jgi:hypothetical protein